MELEIDMGDLEYSVEHVSPTEVRKLIKKAVYAAAMEWLSEAKRIVSDSAVDTGIFLNSIHVDVFEEGDDIGFIGADGVDYGIYWEYGTISHWVPFYYYGDVSKPVLADWGRRVLGMTEEEMLDMGGMEVEIPELKPFMTAMLKAQAESNGIFKKTFGD